MNFRKCLIAGTLLMQGMLALAQAKPPMFDPLFGITYDLKRVQFESAPPVVNRLCGPDMRMRHLFIYAKWIANGTDYYIVSGYAVNHPDGPGKDNISPDEDGIAVAIHGTKCTTDDAGWVMSGQNDSNEEAKLPPTFPESLPGHGARRVCDRDGNCHYMVRSREAQAILDGLASDALDRYSKAFGGKQLFLDALSRSASHTNLLAPVLRRHVEEYRGK